MSAPIILIHYGNSSYLPYIVEVAKRFNPHKEIIFLGDDDNAHLKALGVSHHGFATSCGSPELELFNRLYPRIVNPSYPKSRWAQFVLQRWFMINTFVRDQGIEQFWTFDSDNFIMTDLASHEKRLARYDCTSQCSGRCLNGFVSNAPIVNQYVHKIIDYLSDERYIARWMRKYREDPNLFYNEMEAFADFVKDEKISNFHLARIHNGAMFDDSITYENGMEMYAQTLKGRHVKKLYMCDGQIYCRHIASGSFVRMNNLNLSWMPKYIFPLLFGYISSVRSAGSFTELDLLRAPWSYHVKLFIRNRIPKPIRDQLSGGAYWV